MEAKYSGQCTACDTHFSEGTEIRREPYGWVHAICPEYLDISRPICDDCFTEISASGKCMC